jgi:hypothetical protein
VRVRHHGDTARIELDKNDFSRLLAADVADRVVASLKELGYTYVSLDLAGYRTGSMNEGLTVEEGARIFAEIAKHCKATGKVTQIHQGLPASLLKFDLHGLIFDYNQRHEVGT